MCLLFKYWGSPRFHGWYLADSKFSSGTVLSPCNGWVSPYIPVIALFVFPEDCFWLTINTFIGCPLSFQLIHSPTCSPYWILLSPFICLAHLEIWSSFLTLPSPPVCTFNRWLTPADFYLLMSHSPSQENIYWLSTHSTKLDSRAKFLSLGTIDILGHITLCCGDCPVHWWRY